MPAIRPEAISNRIRLTNEDGAPILALVVEDGAVDAFLCAVVDESSPYKERVSLGSAEHNFLAGTDEQFALSPIGIAAAGIVPFIEREAVKITVLRQPP